VLIVWLMGAHAARHRHTRALLRLMHAARPVGAKVLRAAVRVRRLFPAPLLLWPILLEPWCGRASGSRRDDRAERRLHVRAVDRARSALRGTSPRRRRRPALRVRSLYAALVVAAREPRWPRKLVLGYLVLLPFIAWGVLADFLKNIAITSGPFVASQTGFSAAQREMIAFAYQFGSLIMPTVAPAIAWVVTHRGFLERMRGPAVPR
jgi:hypothetical protein